jgi:hypothetical protein
MQTRVIRRLHIATRKLDTRTSPSQRAEGVELICLLELFEPGQSNVQRRAIQVEICGQPVWREYDIVRSFASPAEAVGYAAEHGIEDVEL